MGQHSNHTFGDPASQMIELAGLGLSIPATSAGGGLPLAIPYGAVASASLAGLYAAAPSLQPMLAPFFATYQGPSGGSGTLSPYNLFNGLPMPSSDDTYGARFGSVSNFELGWTGVIGDKLKLSADIYTYENKGFTYFQAIGQTFALVGSDIPNDLASAVMADITPYATAVLTQVTTAAYQGLAAAFRVGLDESLSLGADIIVNTDGDNQYCGSDIESLIHPIIYNQVDLVVGSRDISNILYFSWTKKQIQKIGSWFVRSIAHSTIVDTTSGFRAYSRKAAMRTIVHSRFSYTLETVIQAGYSQLRVATIPVRTNEKLRESRLASSSWTYLKKSIPTILRIYTMYNPLKVFFFLGLTSLMLGLLLGIRYLYFFILEMSSGHIQSLILASIMIIIGVQIIFIGLVSDLIAANRRLNEEVLYRIKKLELDKK